MTLTVTDDKGESDSCNAVITVVDVTPPMVTCPADIEIECSVAGGVPADDPQLVAFFDGFMAEDNCDDDPDVGNDAPAFFDGPCEAAGGVTVVTWTATDDAGNSTQCSASVTVVDTTPPEIEVTVAPQVLWPPNHKMVDVEYTVTVSDICDDDPQWVLVSLVSNEPDNDNGDGNTEPDIQDADFGTPDSIGQPEGRTGRPEHGPDLHGDLRGHRLFRQLVHGRVQRVRAAFEEGHREYHERRRPAAGGGEISLHGVRRFDLARRGPRSRLTAARVETRNRDSSTPSRRSSVNTAGYVVPSAFYLKDVDLDNRQDVLVAFDQSALEDLRARSDELDGVPVMALEVGHERFMIIEMIEIQQTDLDLDGAIADLRRDGGTDDILVSGPDRNGCRPPGRVDRCGAEPVQPRHHDLVLHPGYAARGAGDLRHQWTPDRPTGQPDHGRRANTRSCGTAPTPEAARWLRVSTSTRSRPGHWSRPRG